MAEPGGSAPRVDVRTLCFVRDGERVLLQQKRRGVYKGLYNAPGGKVERNEDPYDGCLRELREETGLAPAQARLRAVVTVVTRSTGTHWLLFAFTADRPPGEPGPIVDDEGRLRWVPIDEVASLPVVPDIPIILPHLWSDAPGVLMARIEYATDDPGSMVNCRIRTS